MVTATHPARSLWSAMCYPAFHVVSDDLRRALYSILSQLMEAVRGGQAASMPRAQTSPIFVRQD